jgi:hypothetical protein
VKLEKFVDLLKFRFSMKDLGELEWILEVKRAKASMEYIFLSLNPFDIC